MEVRLTNANAPFTGSAARASIVSSSKSDASRFPRRTADSLYPIAWTCQDLFAVTLVMCAGYDCRRVVRIRHGFDYRSVARCDVSGNAAVCRPESHPILVTRPHDPDQCGLPIRSESVQQRDDLDWQAERHRDCACVVQAFSSAAWGSFACGFFHVSQILFCETQR